MRPRPTYLIILLAMLAVFGCKSTRQPGGRIQYEPVPSSILTPSQVTTRLGLLEFFDGYPSPATVEAAYDHLDFMRGVRAFLDAVPIASLYAMREGLREVGCVNGTVGIFEELMDSRTLFLTPNTESVYAMTWLDLSDGPMVVESPPNVLGFVDNAWFQYVTDLGNAGPDRGQGGKFLFLPPGYEQDVPEGYFTFPSATFGNWLIWRGFLVDGDARPAVESMKTSIHVYPLSRRDDPPKQEFLNLSGKYFNTIHASDFSFYEEVARVIQEEPTDALDSEFLGLLAAIGIEKGKDFAPDARMMKILTESAAVGNATARAIGFRYSAAKIYPDANWFTGFVGGSHEFIRDGVLLLDARTLFFYLATGITPAMVNQMVGVGSQYAGSMCDSEGRPMDGGKTYRLQLPPDVPAKDFWSLVLYDNQTRSMLQTDQRFPSLNSQRTVKQNADGSTDIWFGPTPPVGMESNWIQTVPGKGWFTILRLYAPLKPWFDQSWRPGEIQLMENVPAVNAKGQKPGFATEIPPTITTPDRVQTRIGTLEFFDGFPSDETVKLLFENLAFIRGVEAFLSAMPAASVHALLEGQRRDLGIDRNSMIMMAETLMDSRSLYLTPNTESVYMGGPIDLRDGPLVVESPPNTLGMLNDHFFRYVADLGNAGPDRGQGGNYLFLPPDWDGDVPEGYFTYSSPTYRNLLFWRGFLVNGDPGPAVRSAQDTLRIYPLNRPQERQNVVFVNASGKFINTIHANNGDFYQELHEVITEEPSTAFSPEILGLLAAIGVNREQPFAPDDRTRALLEEAAAVGNATARAISFRSRDPRAYLYENSAWFSPFVGGDYEFKTDSGAFDLNARTMFHYPYTAVTPAMSMKRVGAGSQYAVAAVDANGEYLDGSRSYQVILPEGVPAKDFWSFVLYDPQTRSLLQTPGTVYPSVSSQAGDVQANPDGSTTIYFGPRAPHGRESNWVQTVPGKGWFTILRLYGPLEAWFDTTWKPGEIKLIE